eukprot:12793049-Alexandrium_andersonii.AAC.1
MGFAGESTGRMRAAAGAPCMSAPRGATGEACCHSGAGKRAACWRERTAICACSLLSCAFAASSAGSTGVGAGVVA